jgi:hypothetical protein
VSVAARHDEPPFARVTSITSSIDTVDPAPSLALHSRASGAAESGSISTPSITPTSRHVVIFPIRAGHRLWSAVPVNGTGGPDSLMRQLRRPILAAATLALT